MSWPTQSRRRAELPADWPQIRRTVLNRDNHRCQIAGPNCTRHANQVDHIGDRHDHRPQSLRATCHPCHADRTTRQGHDANRQAHAAAKHPTEPHPALRRG